VAISLGIFIPELQQHSDSSELKINACKGTKLVQTKSNLNIKQYQYIKKRENGSL